MNKSNSPEFTSPPALYRIGAVSKLSGVPVPTLRIWQTRYKAFSPTTTLGQHRLYTDEDLRKAALLKSLTGLGHGIRLMAPLGLAQLQQLHLTSTRMGRAASQGQAVDDDQSSPYLRAWGVVGHSLAKRLQSHTFQTLRAGHALPIHHVWTNLSEAQSKSSGDSLDVLMVSVNNLNEPSAQHILALAKQTGTRLTVVLYGFGQTQALAQLNKAGCMVHRNTLDDATLAQIVQNTRPPLSAPLLGRGEWDLAIAPRQFSDAVLQRVANIPSQVLCECPRHVAELIAQLSRFEDYSRDCLSQSPKDHALHMQLNTMAAKARALFEEALQMVASHEGISLQEAD